ncbi:dipeptide epimerase [Corynebacterium pilbarense]|uniref:dipeptide epimerase n=1 Tax=Corynebacterium sp. HMSC034A01 TaxID=1739295 RepID=UPI0008AA1935|nr:dipeptide epimerase [Corynebacterium sp. HMSC034A01]OHR22000.1 dipeptide epimerase [Corynebacterium sp. HMSC034A01]
MENLLWQAWQRPVKVTAVKAHGHRSPLKRPFITAARRTDGVDYVVVDVEIDTATGQFTGQGSAAETVKVTGESAQTILTIINDTVRDRLTGAHGTLEELYALVRECTPKATSARAAVDVALHDAVSRSLELPLGLLLSGYPGASFAPETLEARIQNDMTVSLDAPTAMAEKASEAAADGYSILKIKLGSDPEEDRTRLAAVMEAAPNATLRLDANQGWSPAEAIQLIDKFTNDNLPIDLIEQPVPRDDLDGLAYVTQNSPIPIMADEALWSPKDADRIIELNAANLLNIKLAKTGGLQPALQIAEKARTAGMECMVGAMMEPRISITAGAHLAAVHPAVTMIDLDPPAWFANDVPEGGYMENNGFIALTPGPGLALKRLEPETDPL